MSEEFIEKGELLFSSDNGIQQVGESRERQHLDLSLGQISPFGNFNVNFKG